MVNHVTNALLPCDYEKLHFFGVEVTVEQAEVLCQLTSLDESDPNFPIMAHYARYERLALAAKLTKIFLYGTADTAPDQVKAKDYDNMVTNGFSTIDAGHYIANTKTAYLAFSVINGLRLFAVRLERIVKLRGLSFFPAKFAGGLSLMFAGELAFHSGVMFSNTFLPSKRTKKHNPIPWYQRLKNSFWKDKRFTQLLNAAGWLPINACFFFFSRTVNVIANMIGFAILDIFIAAYTYRRELTKRKSLMQAFNQGMKDFEEAKHTTSRDYIGLTLIRRALKKDQDKVKEDHGYNLGIAIGICISMAFVYLFPSYITGGVLAFVIGSILSGIGKRCKDFVVDYAKKRDKTEQSAEAKFKTSPKERIHIMWHAIRTTPVEALDSELKKPKYTRENSRIILADRGSIDRAVSTEPKCTKSPSSKPLSRLAQLPRKSTPSIREKSQRDASRIARLLPGNSTRVATNGSASIVSKSQETPRRNKPTVTFGTTQEIPPLTPTSSQNSNKKTVRSPSSTLKNSRNLFFKPYTSPSRSATPAVATPTPISPAIPQKSHRRYSFSDLNNKSAKFARPMSLVLSPA